MTIKELLVRLESLANDARDANTDDVVLVAGILYTTIGAIYGGKLRSFAIYVARFNAELLRELDAREN